MTILEAMELALRLGQAGDLQAAEQIYLKIVEAQPDEVEAWRFLAIIAHQLKRPDLTIQRLARWIELRPDSADAHCALGGILLEAGRSEEAIASFSRAIELNHSLVEAHNNLGLVFHNQGRLSEAAQCFREALRSNPQLVQSHANLGNVLKDQRLLGEAIDCMQRAIAIQPNYAEAHYNLGNCFAALDQWVPAAECYQRAIELRPNLAEAYTNLGLALEELGQPSDIVAAHHQQAITLNPLLAAAFSNMGNALKDLGRHDEALAAYRRGLELRPDYVSAHSSLVYTLYFCPRISAQVIAEEHHVWNRQHAKPLQSLIHPLPNDTSPDRRLRIGYVSPYFLSHVQSLFMLPLITSHDHEKFEIFCYSDVINSDETTARLRSYVDVWRDITPLSDEETAQLIRRDQIDILVDLTMHMARGRPLLFARKPAPVQVCWLAYPGTTGISAIDYRLTDPYLDPPGLFDHFYTEKSIRLPDTFWCYDPQSNLGVNRLPALECGHVTFGSFNNPCKLNPDVLRLWSRVLKAVDRSRLILLVPTESQRHAIRQLLEQDGITADRIAFLDRQPRQKYLEYYHEIDISLDTVPYNGHTTSLDAYWMGVPVVTLVGETVVGRAGYSQLINLGLPDLIAQSPDQFVTIASDLARDLARVEKLRRTLRQRMEASPLMDAPRFARNIEMAYREMWRRWCCEGDAVFCEA